MFQRFADSFAKKLRESRLWLRPNAHATHAIPEPNFYTTRYVYNVCVVNYGATYNFSITKLCEKAELIVVGSNLPVCWNSCFNKLLQNGPPGALEVIQAVLFAHFAQFVPIFIGHAKPLRIARSDVDVDSTKVVVLLQIFMSCIFLQVN